MAHFEKSGLIRDLREGKEVLLEGCYWKMAEGELQFNDWYIAERNAGPKLLTVREVNKERRWVVPNEPYAYLYDTWECVKVELVCCQ